MVAASLAGSLLAPLATGQAISNVYDLDLAKSRAAMDRHEWTSAETQLRQYLTQHPEADEAMYLLAETLFHEDRPKESLAMYTRAAAGRRPGAQEFHFIALDYVLLHDDTDADRWITQAAREDPHNGEIAYAMGRIKYTENRFAEAVTSFEKALVLMPHSVKTENNLGLTFEGLNEADKAVVAYRQAIAWQAGEAHPSEQPLLNLGILLTDRNQLSEALPLLQQAAGAGTQRWQDPRGVGQTLCAADGVPRGAEGVGRGCGRRPEECGAALSAGPDLSQGRPGGEGKGRTRTGGGAGRNALFRRGQRAVGLELLFEGWSEVEPSNKQRVLRYAQDNNLGKV